MLMRKNLKASVIEASISGGKTSGVVSRLKPLNESDVELVLSLLKHCINSC